MTERRTLADRLAGAGILPHHLEAAGLTVVLCELLDELIVATNRQTALLAGRLADPTETREGQNAGAAAPSGEPEKDDQVQLREPELPPEDLDGEPTPPGQPVAGAVAKSKATAKSTSPRRSRAGSQSQERTPR